MLPGLGFIYYRDVDVPIGRLPDMDLTESYKNCFDQITLSRYRFRETRNCSAIINATSPTEFQDISDVLSTFKLTNEHLTTPGGNKSMVAKDLDDAFRVKGWREARIDTSVTLKLVIMPYGEAGETERLGQETTVENEGYKVDNFSGSIVLDVEWNAKDGNLDRDLAAYRSLYDAGLIDAAVIITRTTTDLRELAIQAVNESSEPRLSRNKPLDTATTTNLDKLLPRMTRGDGGGCPILAVAICAQTK